MGPSDTAAYGIMRVCMLQGVTKRAQCDTLKEWQSLTEAYLAPVYGQGERLALALAWCSTSISHLIRAAAPV